MNGKLTELTEIGHHNANCSTGLVPACSRVRPLLSPSARVGVGGSASARRVGGGGGSVGDGDA
jgi:hypothetical protein